MTSYMESLLQEPGSLDHENTDQHETLADDNHSSNNIAKVDTSRAFHYVKEVVAIFDERLLAKTQPSKLPSSHPPLPPQLPLVLTTSSISPIKQKPKEDGNFIVQNIKEIIKMERYSTSFAEVLSLGERDYFYYFQDKKTIKKNKMTNTKKEKPIIPHLGDLFSRKKKNSSKSLNKL
ncbi:hypothetical protein MKX01_006721 [Papaver californicum]|nr:hypothetical protein MKX01_006721 [Papaver californicum]